jgi:hypothetical protein
MKKGLRPMEIYLEEVWFTESPVTLAHDTNIFFALCPTLIMLKALLLHCVEYSSLQLRTVVFKKAKHISKGQGVLLFDKGDESVELKILPDFKAPDFTQGKCYERRCGSAEGGCGGGSLAAVQYEGGSVTGHGSGTSSKSITDYPSRSYGGSIPLTEPQEELVSCTTNSSTSENSFTYTNFMHTFNGTSKCSVGTSVDRAVLQL